VGDKKRRAGGGGGCRHHLPEQVGVIGVSQGSQQERKRRLTRARWGQKTYPLGRKGELGSYDTIY